MSIVLFRSTCRDGPMLKALVKGEMTFVDSFMTIVKVTSHDISSYQTKKPSSCVVTLYYLITRTLLLICSFQLLHLRGGK